MGYNSKRMKLINIYVEVYKRAVTICIGSADEFSKYRKELIEEIDPECTADFAPARDYSGHTCVVGDVGFVVHILEEPLSGSSIGVLVHELSHVTNSILRDSNIPLTEETEEAYTYLLEYLTREALDKNNK